VRRKKWRRTRIRPASPSLRSKMTSWLPGRVTYRPVALLTKILMTKIKNLFMHYSHVSAAMSRIRMKVWSPMCV
jgi:hypothetical protein